MALRSVKEGESTAPPSKAKSVQQAAASGDHRELLVAMRSRLATAVTDPDCPPRDLAALTRRLQDIAKEISSLDLRDKQEAKESAELGGDAAWDAAAI